MAEWERGTIVNSDQFRLLLRKLHGAMALGVPFRMEINSDGKKLGPVKVTVTTMDGDRDVCDVVEAEARTA